MSRIIFSIIALVLLQTSAVAQSRKTKLIDDGGSGPFKAVAVSEPSLPDFVVYRPENIVTAVQTEHKLPVIVWANGGCMNSSIHHERMLNEIASYGYIVVAIGALQMTVEERVHKHTKDDILAYAVSWITRQAKTKGSDYCKNVDLKKIVAGGQSCGGAQVMRVAGDDRIKKYMMFNSGMGDMTMAGASKESLKSLHGEIIYIVGGETDVATKNALLDYERITQVPVVLADMLSSGHGGTFNQKYGGPYARLAIDWLDWQLKGKDKSRIFRERDLSDYPGWTLKSKNYKD